MKKVLPLGVAVYGLVILLSATILFHFLVLAGIVPFTIVWGGNLATATQFYTMEAISIAINASMLVIILVYCGVINLGIPRKVVIGAIWAMALLFFLNTLENLTAKNVLETYIFTPLTLLLSIFCFRIAVFERQQKKLAS